MKKIINSAEREYQPVETQNLVLDAVPTVNSFNGVTSDAVARAIAGASGEVPQVLEGDNGKILTAVYDEGGPAVEWAEAQGGSSYTAGDGIAISEGEISAKVDGTTIQVNASGALEAIGGGGSGGVQLIPVPALNAAIAETLYGVIGNALTAGQLPVLVTTNSTNSADKRYWPLTHIQNLPDPSYGGNYYFFTVIEQVFNNSSSTTMLYDLYQEDIVVGLDNFDGAYNAAAHRYQVATAVAQASFDPFTA